jgi:Cdc6-like AAA superfamily ATPase
MNIFDSSTEDTQDLQVYNTIKPHSELITEQIYTLPLHFKLVLSACTILLGQNEKNIKVALEDVFSEYRELATELNIDWLSMNRINDLAKELEMLGFLKCTYTRKRDGRVRYVRFFEPAQIPKYASILQEELGKVRLEKDMSVM